MVEAKVRHALKEGTFVRFKYGLRQLDGKVVEAIVPLKIDQPIVYRIAFSLPDEDDLEVVLSEGDVLRAGRRSPPRHRTGGIAS